MKKNEKPKFDLFIDAAADSSTRSRAIIVLLLTTSFIILLALFNSLKQEFNWLKSRIAATKNLFEWIVLPDDSTYNHPKFYKIEKELSKKGIVDSIVMPFSINDIGHLNMKSELYTNDISIKHLKLQVPLQFIKNDTIYLNEIDTNKLILAIRYAENIKPVSRRELFWLLNNYNRARLETSTLIDVPILGITIDVNGLSVISAITFSILYFLLFYNLSRERKNITLVFKTAPTYGYDQVLLYQLVTMRQVLGIPHSIDEYITGNDNEEKRSFLYRSIQRFKYYVPILPIILPIIIWILIFCYDYFGTSNVGYSINPRLTKIGYIFSFMLSIIMMITFYYSLREWRKIDELFEAQAKEIETSRNLTKRDNSDNTIAAG